MERHVAMLMEESDERKKKGSKCKKKKIVPLYISVTAQCLRSIVESHTPPALQRQPAGSAWNYTGSHLQPCGAAPGGWRRGIGEVPG